MKQNDRLAEITMKIAKEKLGIKEATGHNDGVFVRMLQRWLARGAKWMDGQPWCATFATYCIYQAAEAMQIHPLINRSGSSTDIFRDARLKHLDLLSPIPNCIGLMRGDGGTRGKTHHHTFLVESVDFGNGVVHGVDGNWKNAVSKTVHKISDCDFVMIA
jgi:hypothetical protein